MSNRTIHYINVNHRRFDDSLVRQSDLDDERFVYNQCPVFKHKSSRTFLGISPINFKLQVVTSPDGVTYIRTTKESIIDGDDADINSPRPVIQLKFPQFIFWTHDSDIWLEQYDHPMTALDNNFITIGGWFNLSNWTRGSSLGITIVDSAKPVIIRKGDPLFRMSFHSPNPDDGIILSQEKDPDKIDLIYEEYRKKQEEGQRERTWVPKLFSKTSTNSKCPFSFLFK